MTVESAPSSTSAGLAVTWTVGGWLTATGAAINRPRVPGCHPMLMVNPDAVSPSIPKLRLVRNPAVMKRPFSVWKLTPSSRSTGSVWSKAAHAERLTGYLRRAADRASAGETDTPAPLKGIADVENLPVRWRTVALESRIERGCHRLAEVPGEHDVAASRGFSGSQALVLVGGCEFDESPHS